MTDCKSRGTELRQTRVADQSKSVVGSHRKSLSGLLAVCRRRRHAGHIAARPGVHALHRAGHPGRELRVSGSGGSSGRVHELMRTVASGHRVAGGVRVATTGVVMLVHGAHHAVTRGRRRRQRLGQLLLLLAILGATVLKPHLTPSSFSRVTVIFTNRCKVTDPFN